MEGMLHWLQLVFFPDPVENYRKVWTHQEHIYGYSDIPKIFET